MDGAEGWNGEGVDGGGGGGVPCPMSIIRNGHSGSVCFFVCYFEIVGE